MGGGAATGAKYANCIVEVSGLTTSGLAASVTGWFRFDLATGVSREDVSREITRRGKQLGVLIRRDQTITDFAFNNGGRWQPYTASDAVARACAAGLAHPLPERDVPGFGEADGDRWVGFELAPGMSITPDPSDPGRMAYQYRFTLHNFRTRFQAVPIIHACLDLPISRLHVVSVCVLRVANPRITSAVDSNIDIRSTT